MTYADIDMDIINDFRLNKIYSYVSVHNKNTIEAGLHLNYPFKPRNWNVPDMWFYYVPPQLNQCKKYHFGWCQVDEEIFFNNITDDTISGDTIIVPDDIRRPNAGSHRWSSEEDAAEDYSQKSSLINFSKITKRKCSLRKAKRTEKTEKEQKKVGVTWRSKFQDMQTEEKEEEHRCTEDLGDECPA